MISIDALKFLPTALLVVAVGARLPPRMSAGIVLAILPCVRFPVCF